MMETTLANSSTRTIIAAATTAVLAPVDLRVEESATGSDFAIDRNNTRGPDEAYQLAEGKQVISVTGVPAKLVRPLHRLVVTDHTETLGVPLPIQRSDSSLLATEIGRGSHDLYMQGKVHETFAYLWLRVLVQGHNPIEDPGVARSVWEEMVVLAKARTEPVRFADFIGHECLAMPGGSSPHRVVAMRDDRGKASEALPFVVHARAPRPRSACS